MKFSPKQLQNKLKGVLLATRDASVNPVRPTRLRNLTSYAHELAGLLGEDITAGYCTTTEMVAILALAALRIHTAEDETEEGDSK